LLSDFIDVSLFSLLLPRLLIRKKFLSFCGKGLWPFACLLDVIERPEKFRFSLGGEFEEKLWKAVVIEDELQHSRGLLLVIEY
jgi:hypothetical protein